MIKTINVSFDETEHKILKKIKGKTNWHDFIMSNVILQKLVKKYHKDFNMTEKELISNIIESLVN